MASKGKYLRARSTWKSEAGTALATFAIVRGLRFSPEKASYSGSTRIKTATLPRLGLHQNMKRPRPQAFRLRYFLSAYSNLLVCTHTLQF